MSRQIKYRVFWKACEGFVWSRVVIESSRKRATAKVRLEIPAMEHIATVPESVLDRKYPTDWPDMDEVRKL